MSSPASAYSLFLLLLWFLASLIFRWRFQLSLRLLFVLTIAVAYPFSCSGGEEEGEEEREVVEEIQEAWRQHLLLFLPKFDPDTA